MTPQTILFVIRRCCLLPVICLEPSPAPTIAPEIVAGVAVFSVLHHDEPPLQASSMADGACRLFSGCGLKHLLHEHRTVRETSVLAIGGNGAGRRIDNMELLRTPALIGCHRPAAQQLIGGAIVIGHMQIPRDYSVRSWHAARHCRADLSMRRDDD